jgi:hypothetical protein
MPNQRPLAGIRHCQFRASKWAAPSVVAVIHISIPSVIFTHYKRLTVIGTPNVFLRAMPANHSIVRIHIGKGYWLRIAHIACPFVSMMRARSDHPRLRAAWSSAAGRLTRWNLNAVKWSNISSASLNRRIAGVISILVGFIIIFLRARRRDRQGLRLIQHCNHTVQCRGIRY